MLNERSNELVLYFGTMAFMLASAIMFFVGIPMKGAEGYEGFITAWGYISLVMGVLLLGATIYTVPNDTYFDKWQLLFLVPGAWFIFDAVRCFSGNTTRELTTWCAVVIAVYGALFGAWSLLDGNETKETVRMTVVIAVLYAAVFFAQNADPLNIIPFMHLIVGGLIIIASLVTTWRFFAKRSNSY